MIPKFVPVMDLQNSAVYPGSSIKGVKSHHKDWGDLYKDQGVGDSLANTVRHWNEECLVDIPFLIIGGGESITGVLAHDANVRFSTPYETGIVAITTKYNKTFGKSYTSVLVVPASCCRHPRAKKIENLGELRAMVNVGRLDNATPGETLAQFRLHWQLFNHIYDRYINV